jgi:hypothetical protein
MNGTSRAHAVRYYDQDHPILTTLALAACGGTNPFGKSDEALAREAVNEGLLAYINNPATDRVALSSSTEEPAGDSNGSGSIPSRSHIPAVPNSCREASVHRPYSPYAPAYSSATGVLNAVSDRTGNSLRRMPRKRFTSTASTGFAAMVSRAYTLHMKALKVRVENGRLVGDAPEGIEEGTELELCVAEPEESMSDEELAALNAALERAWRSVQAGRVRPAADLIAELRARR